VNSNASELAFQSCQSVAVLPVAPC
jgi:hypothetical protein